jgi:D-xylose reductase
MPVSTIKLASGHDMPLVGFGLWKVPAEQAADTVYNVSRGIRKHAGDATS